MKKFFIILLFPFFPDNSWLRKHWWHRLALIIAGSVTTLGLIISIFLIYVFVGQLKDYLTPFDPIKKGATPVTQADISKMDRITGLGQTNKNTPSTTPNADGFIPDNPQPQVNQMPDYLTDEQMNKLTAASDMQSTLKWIIFWLLAAYLIPSGIYRVILFVLTDNKWKINK